MGWKQKVANAHASTNAIYPEPGQYTVEILKVKEKVSKDGDDLVIAELRVLASNNPARPANSTMDWVLNMRYPSSPPDAMAFFCQLTEAPEEQITEDVMGEITGPNQPFAGKRLDVMFYNKPTKSGGVFTAAKWLQPASRAA